MQYFRLAFVHQLFLINLLVLTCILGDFLVMRSNLHAYRAFFDNSTHGAVGGLIWLIVVMNSRRRSAFALLEIVGCTVLASAVDLDHFIAAKSFDLEDALSLKSRPFLHCTTVPLAIFALLVSLAHWSSSETCYRLGWMVLTAVLSHHTRDAHRRGFWFYPMGSTRPIPYVVYVGATVLMPYAVCLAMTKLSGVVPQKPVIQSSVEI